MNFEERLLMELKTHLLERAETESVQPGPPTPSGGAPRRIGRRLAAGAALLGAAAVAAVAVPLVTGTQTPAYALTKNPDGTIRVQINELRDPDRLEADLRAQGVTADVAYLPEGKKCAADPDPDPDPGEQTGRLYTKDDGRPGSDAHGKVTHSDKLSGGEAGTRQERHGDDGQNTGGAAPRTNDEENGGPGDRHGKVTHSHDAEAGIGYMERDGYGDGDAGPVVEPKSTNVFVISPASLKPGHTVVLRFTEKGDKTYYTLGWRVAEEPVTPCSVVAG